ncbi:MAG: hypothetical protein WA066_06785, partial [Candidatus Omnitrophota bacterium]
RIEQVEERYSNLNVPVEVALPYYWDIYEPIRGHLSEIAEKIKSYHAEALSIHAVQAPIRNEKTIWSLLEGYKQNIKNVHLSAKDENKQHLPIDSFCKEVVNYVIESRWDGNVILEYLFEFHDQMLNDLQLLKAMQ